MTDYYAILGVSRTATANEIRDAYLKLARDTHPDKVKDREARKQAEDVFKNVTAAYDTLSKERSRRDHTAKLPAVNEPNTAGASTTTTKAAPPMVQGRPLPPRDQKPGPAPAPAAPTGAASSPPPAGSGGPDVLAQGIEAYKNKDYHTAVQLLNLAVSQNEGSAKAHAMLSLALAKNPNWVREAVGHLETASKLDPKNVAYLAELAILLQSQGLKLRAKRALESAIALNPEHPDVARAMKEVPLDPTPPESALRHTAETARGLFDRLRKR